MEIRKLSFVVMLLMMTSVAILPIATSLRAYGEETSLATIYLDPAAYIVANVGETFKVEVKITNASGLQGFEFKLSYDTVKLDAVEVVEGSFLKGFGETLPFKLEINKTLGFVWVAVVLLGAASAEGDGTLATVGFKSTSTGENIFGLCDTKLGGPSGKSIDHYVTDGYSVDKFVDPLPTVAQSQIDAAIAKGMGWLAAQQNIDGSWGTSDQAAMTGFAVLKFETHAIQENIDPLSMGYQYHSQVRNGLDYIFLNANPISITVQPPGNPDTDNDGLGVYWAGSEGTTYYTGIAMMAIASSEHAEMTVSVTGSAVNGWTYEQVLGDAVDYLAFGQTDAGLGRGGWGYGANWGSSDNSNTGYAVQGLAYAEAGSGCAIPSFVRSELNIFINIIQDPVNGDSDDGGSWYNPDWGWDHWVNILKTGNLLFEMAFYGDANTSPRVQNAVNYVVHHWNDANVDPGWKGQPSYPANYQAMYTTMKGLEALGIDTIGGIGWFNDFANVLVFQQNLDGSWPPCDWGNSMLATEWALLTLERAMPLPLPPGHDVAVTGVTPSTSFVYRPNLLAISVVVKNLGEYAETFDVTVFYGDFPTSTQWNTFWNTFKGDINKDGYINAVDAAILASDFGKRGPPGWIPSDLYPDGIINILDAILLSNNFGRNIWSYFSLHGGILGTQTVSNLAPGGSRTLAFTWNTSGFALGDYTIGAYAWPVQGETHEVDNKFIDGVVTIAAHKLTVNTDPPELVPAPSVDPGPTPDGFYDDGTLVTLTANAVNGYTFKNWEVNPLVTPQAQPDKMAITMDQDYTATAHYVPFTMNGFMTDSDFNPITSFDVVFSPSSNVSSLKLTATNPGTYYCTLQFTNNGPAISPLPIKVKIPNDFVLKGGQPVQIDFVPVAYVGPDSSGILSTTVATVAAGQTFTLRVHLDYGLKGTTPYPADSQTTYYKIYEFKTTVCTVTGKAPAIVATGKKLTAIGGLVTDANGVPKNGLKVELTNPSGSKTYSQTGVPGDGFYFFAVQPGGPYTIRVYNSMNVQVAIKTNIQVAQDAFVETDFNTLSPADPVIQGFVTSNNRNPVAGVTVKLLNSRGQSVATTSTNRGGYYVFRFNQPGKYTVRITAPSGYGVSTESVTLTVKQFESVTVNFSLDQK
jgi:hypothetical protein